MTQMQHQADEAARARSRRRVSTVKHLLVFQIKLVLEGLKDLVLGPLSLAAAALDFIAANEAPDRYLDAVMRMGARYEEWLGLYRLGGAPDPRTFAEAIEVSQAHPPGHPANHGPGHSLGHGPTPIDAPPEGPRAGAP